MVIFILAIEQPGDSAPSFRSALPQLYWPILMLTLLAYAILTRSVKVWLLRKNWIKMCLTANKIDL
jgi:hypothetical protein